MESEKRIEPLVFRLRRIRGVVEGEIGETAPVGISEYEPRPRWSWEDRLFFTQDHPARRNLESDVGFSIDEAAVWGRPVSDLSRLGLDLCPAVVTDPAPCGDQQQDREYRRGQRRFGGEKTEKPETERKRRTEDQERGPAGAVREENSRKGKHGD